MLYVWERPTSGATIRPNTSQAAQVLENRHRQVRKQKQWAFFFRIFFGRMATKKARESQQQAGFSYVGWQCLCLASQQLVFETPTDMPAGGQTPINFVFKP